MLTELEINIVEKLSMFLDNQPYFICFADCDCPKASGPNTAELICDATGECVCPNGYNLNPKGQCLAASKL